MTNLNEIGKIIKSRRKLLQLTQDELAEISGISLRSLKSMELGKGNPSIEQLDKVLDAIGLKMSVGKK